MEFKAWRNWSVLLLAGLALVGCNHTPDKNKGVFGTSPKIGDPYAKAQPDPKFPTTNSPFPVQPASNASNPPKSPFTPASGSNNNPATLNPGYASPSSPNSFTPPTNPGNFASPNGPNIINPPVPNSIAPPPISAPGASNFGIHSTTPLGGAGDGPLNVPPPSAFQR